MQQTRQKHIAQGLAASLREFGQGEYPNLWTKIGTLTTPTLIITGKRDQKYTAIGERFASIVNTRNGSKTVTLRTLLAGHAPHFETPDLTAEVIDQFISSTL